VTAAAVTVLVIVTVVQSVTYTRFSKALTQPAARAARSRVERIVKLMGDHRSGPRWRKFGGLGGVDLTRENFPRKFEVESVGGKGQQLQIDCSMN
jgi:hypothetical protein